MAFSSNALPQLSQFDSTPRSRVTTFVPLSSRDGLSSPKAGFGPNTGPGGDKSGGEKKEEPPVPPGILAELDKERERRRELESQLERFNGSLVSVGTFSADIGVGEVLMNA